MKTRVFPCNLYKYFLNISDLKHVDMILDPKALHSLMDLWFSHNSQTQSASEFTVHISTYIKDNNIIARHARHVLADFLTPGGGLINSMYVLVVV